MLFRLLLALFILGAMAPASSAWGDRLRLGVLPVLDTLPLHVGLAEGHFQEQGIELELVSFASAIERETAMQSGRIDGIYGDIVNVMLLVRSGVDMKIVTVCSASRPGRTLFGLVSAPKVGQLAPEEMAGRSVGISNATVIEWLMDSFEDSGQVPAGAFERIEIKKIPIRMQMLMAGEIDAAVLPEPLVSLAVSKGGAVLATDEPLDMPLTVLCFADDVLDKDLGERFLAAYDTAVTAIAADPAAYRELLVKAGRIPPPLAPTFPIYVNEPASLPDPQALDAVQAWMIEEGLLDARRDYADVVHVAAP
jgi:NitT/TauT family transport system substrate-binding protein